ncbi:MAG TPA: glycosyltransferase family 39 protein [Planctomycetota bacterium]|nr:glycosyltransferase family 39 protein [Planctomycetota bacterium]
MESPESPRPLEAADVRRTSAWVSLAAITLLSFGLSVWGFRVGLPTVYHSDYVQVEQAAELLINGSFREGSSYPITHVYLYAAADLAAYGLGRAQGIYDSWGAFTTQLEQGALQHEIARVYTALLASFIPVAVYLLAPRWFPRKVGLLAAAMVAFSPVLVIHAHQARIHGPGLLFLVLAAIPVAKIAGGELRAGSLAMAGVACGVAGAIYQLGVLLFGAAVLTALLRAPTWPRRAMATLAVALGFGATLGILWCLCHGAGLVTRPQGFEPNPLTLGIPPSFLGFHVVDRLPQLLVRWMAAEPIVAIGALVYGARVARAPSPRIPLLAYGLFPALVFSILGTNYVEVRYSMSATPFLAILAAAAIHDTRSTWLRAPLVATAVAVPLSLSLRYDWLVVQPDTRQELHEILTHADPNGQIWVETCLVGRRPRPFAGVELFPPKGDFRPLRNHTASPEQMLESAGVQTFVRARASRRPTEFHMDPRRVGFRKHGEISPGAVPASALPDAPDYLVVDLWLASKCGPPIEIWVNSQAAAEAMNRILPSDALVCR